MMINSLSAIQGSTFAGFKDGIVKDVKPAMFSDALQNASRQIGEKKDTIQIFAQSTGKAQTISESGKNSAGKKVLTDVQKQYLRDKYNLSDPSDLSSSELDQLLIELTNGGALSYQDYQMEDMRPVSLIPTVITSREAPAGDPFSSCKNYCDYFQQVIQGEKREAAFMKECGAEPPSAYSICIAAHERIEDLLSSLL